MKTPISLIIDDPAPVISSLYESGISATSSYEHVRRSQTKDGRPLLHYFPNSLLFKFCDVIDKYGIKGKFSVIPMPGNKGDIINGIEGVSRSNLDEWISTVKARVADKFSICPEMLTHNLAVNLETGEALNVSEMEWSRTQTKETLTPYISKALSILKEAGFDSFGVTSPWRFGIDVESEYEAAISQAVYDVTGKKESWVFLRGLRNTPNAKPWVAYDGEGRVLVSIPATTSDVFWQTMDTPNSSEAYASSIADILITEDGKSGDVIQVLETGGYPILIAHWQSLMSNGLGTGIRALEIVAERIKKNLDDRVEWMSFEEIMKLVVANKSEYPRPKF